MATRLLRSMIVLMCVLTFSHVSVAQTAPSSEAPKAAKAKAPAAGSRDIWGVWVLPSSDFLLSNTVPPMTPWAKAKFNETKPGYGPRMVPPALGNDPLGMCDPLGFPRIMFAAIQRPLELIQTKDRVLEHFQYHEVWRTIWTDGRQLPQNPDPRWYGYSIGKWDGDTFVVDSAGYDERTWLDHFGDPHSDQMHVTERYKRVGDTLVVNLTVTDPKAYTHPWVSDTKVFKNPTAVHNDRDVLTRSAEIGEEICAPSEESNFNKVQRDPAAGKENQ